MINANCVASAGKKKIIIEITSWVVGIERAVVPIVGGENVEHTLSDCHGIIIFILWQALSFLISIPL